MRKLLPILFLCLTTLGLRAQDFKPYYSNNFNFGASYTLGNLRGGYAVGDGEIDYVGLQFNYIGLMHISPKVALGLGTGLRHTINVDDFWNDWTGWDDDWNDEDFVRSYYSVPLYAHAQFRFIDRRVSPFLATSLGYNFRVGEDNNSFNSGGTRQEDSSRLLSGLMAGAQAGVSIRVGDKFNIMAGPYFEYRQSELRHVVRTWDNGATTSTGLSNDIDLFEVGLKVGFAF